MRAAVPILVLSLLAACSSEPEPVANRFDRTNAEIENKARALEADVENQVSAVETQMQNEIDVLANTANPRAAEDNSVNSAR